MMSTMVCRECGKKVTFTDLERKVINIAGDILADKGLKFNVLTLADKEAKCCNEPDYHYELAGE